MFRSIFGTKSDRPTPPKNQIEVVCPACGEAQYEPRLVVSTFCKKCGVHLSIHRKRVTASNVTRSGIGSVENWQNGHSAPQAAAHTAPQAVPAAPPAAHAATHPLPSAHLPAAPAPDLPELTEPVTEEEAAEGGFGVFLKQQSAPSAGAVLASIVAAKAPKPIEDEAPAPDDAEAPEPQEAAVAAFVEKAAPVPDQPAALPQIPDDLFSQHDEQAASRGGHSPDPAARRPQSNSPPPTQAPQPMSASTLQKMKEQGMYRNQYFKDAECFECQHRFKVSRSSRAASCPACGAAIAMEDVEINMLSTQPVKTRGDVLIRKRGIISTDIIRCKDLRCYGTLEANVEATGDAIFRTTGTIVGTVRCKRLVIEKGADVTFLNKTYAEEVDIQARVTGTLISSGLLLIGANGIANGDVTARSVSIEPGGELNGAMNIVRGPAKPKPPQPPPDAEEAPEGA